MWYKKNGEVSYLISMSMSIYTLKQIQENEC